MSETELILGVADAGAADAAGPAAELQALWLRLRRSDWKTLAIVPVNGGIAIGSFARALCAAGTLTERTEVTVASGEALASEGLAALAADLRAHDAEAGLQLVALPSPLATPQSSAVALAADAALLCIELETTAMADARRIIDAVGAHRFVGCVALRRS
jgi:hypothetical protein